MIELPKIPEGQPIDQLSSFKLYTLMNISRQINSLMELGELLELIMEYGKVLLNAEGSSLMLVDREKQVLIFQVVTGDRGHELREMEVPLDQGIAGLVARTGESLLINDAANDPRVFKAADELTSMTTNNLICVPMVTNNEVIGVLEAINAIDRPGFDNDDLLLLMSFAEQAAISITNRRLFDAERARAEELNALFEIGQLALHNDGPSELLAACLAVVSRVASCNRSSILMFEESTNRLIPQAAIGVDSRLLPPISLPMENRISATVFRTMRPIYSRDIEKDTRFGPNPQFRYTTRSFISVPLKTRQRAIGVLNVTDKKNGATFTTAELHLMVTIANQISEVFENQRLYTEEKVKIKIEKELEVTRHLQEAIFPKSFPALPGVTIFGMNLSASEVGGDFYDFYYQPTHPDTFSAVIADVSGKSVPAALFMAISRSVLRAQAMAIGAGDPHLLLEQANQLLVQDSESAMFVTAFYFNYDISSRTLLYSNAGHNDPLLLRKGTETPEYLHTRGKPLGIMEDARYEQSSLLTAPGDLLILYTDGIIEANNPQEEEYGQERFEAVVLANRERSSEEIARAISDDVRLFAQGAPQFDDITLYVFRFA